MFHFLSWILTLKINTQTKHLKAHKHGDCASQASDTMYLLFHFLDRKQASYYSFPCKKEALYLTHNILLACRPMWHSFYFVFFVFLCNTSHELEYNWHCKTLIKTASNTS